MESIFSLKNILSEPLIFKISITVIGAVILNIILNYVFKYLIKIGSMTKSHWDESILKALYSPLMLLLWIIVLKIITFQTASHFSKSGLSWSLVFIKIAIIISISWFLTRLSDLICENFIKNKEKNNVEIDKTTAGAILKLVKLLIFVFAILACLQNLGISISGFLAAGGVGGLVIGFAAKDLLANFFGGLTIYLDKPFKVGDWIRSSEIGIEGTVEYIGWRHTRIRAFNKNPIYIPNASFTTIVVENPSRMLFRRIRENIGIRYCDIAKMQIITDEIRAMLDGHEEVDKENPAMAYFVSFGPSSIDFMINALIKNTEWHHFSKVKHEILLKIAEIIESHGAEVAFPTRTIHVENDS